MRLKTKILAVLIAAIVASTMAVAAEEPSEQVKRMDAAATVLDEIMGIPDKGIPEELLDSAKCVAVIPSMVEIGFVFEAGTEEESRPAVPLLDGARLLHSR
jgi:lipid-binding SYLF domain-containing protein